MRWASVESEVRKTDRLIEIEGSLVLLFLFRLIMTGSVVVLTESQQPPSYLTLFNRRRSYAPPESQES